MAPGFFEATFLGILAIVGLFLWARALECLIYGSEVKNLNSILKVEFPNPPKVSIIFSARNEENHVSETIQSLLNQTYPHIEIIAVNDRSNDETGPLLKRFQKQDSRIKVVTVDQVKPGWAAKSFGLWSGFKQSSGEWILFTDADIQFHSDSIWEAVSYAKGNKVDHLTAFPEIDLKGVIVTPTLLCFSFLMILSARPWKLKSHRNSDVIGIGAFNLINRSVYEKIGTHKAFKSELIDDIGLASMTKSNGFKLDGIIAHDRIKLKWQTNLRSLIKGLEKNFFPFLRFSYVAGIFSVLAPNFLVWMPVAGLFWGGAWGVGLGGAALGALFIILLKVRRYQKAPLVLVFLIPVGIFVLSWALMKSMWATRKQGGVMWRDTFYSLDRFGKPTWKKVGNVLKGRFELFP